MDEAEKVKSAVERYFDGIRSWQETVDPVSFVLCFLFLVLIVLLRRPVAAFIVRLGHKFFSAQNVELDQPSLSVVEAGTRTVIVSFALLLFLDAMGLPDPLGRTVVLLSISAIVISVFTTLYGLASHLSFGFPRKRSCN